MSVPALDCVVIGYNEVPFNQYEEFLRQYGEDTEAYRDLRFSFINVDGRKMDYMGMMNYAAGQAASGEPLQPFRSSDIPNLAAVYLANFLRGRGFSATYINLFQHEKSRLEALLAERPACVALTTTFYVVNLAVREMVQFIRERNEETRIIVGGPLIANHVRNAANDEELRTVLADIGADIYVIESQGERTLANIVACLKNGGEISAIPNLAYIKDRRLNRTTVLPENNSLDENAIDWRNFTLDHSSATLQTRTARSCAFKCAFCNYPTRAGALMLTSLNVIERELDSMRESGEIKNVVFIDDTFNVPFPRFKEICRLMIRKNYGFNWFSYFRCSNSDEEAMDLMAASGCKGVFLGVESGAPTILANMNKFATIEKYAQGIRWLRQRGIMTFGSFIAGFPGETAATIRETTEFIQENRPDYYRCQLWYCEPGTPIQKERAKYLIEGNGFIWSHATMESLEAMDHIERMFLSIKESVWLPQWSFDFWTIPYFIGRGLSMEQFKDAMKVLHKLLTLDVASVPDMERKRQQQEYLARMVAQASGWTHPAPAFSAS